eukprot:NODE_118_length_18285_cov_1.016606.p11 type:complete len:129 gc:universal NODE_118_length_18285_cov_1.016606:15129-15515(+)
MEEEKLRKLQGPSAAGGLGKKEKGEFDDLISSIKSGKAFMQKKPDKLMKKKKSNISITEPKSLSQKSSSSFVAELKEVQNGESQSLRQKSSTAPSTAADLFKDREIKRNPSDRLSKTDEMMKKMNQRM